ncbi:37S ribosomal protein RSM18 [Colletotrichum sidae]|uniref:Small ribosomal subunit protein bS18m n=2 Tax=Colletotrichum orbiculare species complex TaxID=2707354 RepID=A0A4R8QUC2_9PEZI|nr:37S ribosomal protein RSM18 [Colletotrichum spinosum]TEA13297.1 37S ribosomal protein RSM18 [Colletotrichum sidae]
MPPRLSSLPAFTAPSAFMARVARPFSSTPAVAQTSGSGSGSNPISNPISNLLNLDEKAPVHSADRIRSLINRSPPRDVAAARKRTMMDQLKERKISDDYLRQMPRRFRNGDVYAPHDLSPVEMDKWRKIRRPTVDVVDMLGINPLDHYRNFSIISEFMSSFGQILHSTDTGLRPVNHRKMAKAIRRAIGMGIHPSVHQHPEILKSKLRMKSAWR